MTADGSLVGGAGHAAARAVVVPVVQRSWDHPEEHPSDQGVWRYAIVFVNFEAKQVTYIGARGAREAPPAVGEASSQPPRGVCCLLLMNSPLAIHKTNNPPLVCYQTTGGLLSDHRGFVIRPPGVCFQPAENKPALVCYRSIAGFVMRRWGFVKNLFPFSCVAYHVCLWRRRSSASLVT